MHVKVKIGRGKIFSVGVEGGGGAEERQGYKTGAPVLQEVGEKGEREFHVADRTRKSAFVS